MTDDFSIGAWAMVHYLYNTSGYKFAYDVFPDSVPQYQQEKAENYAKSPARAMGFLDLKHRQRLLEAVRQFEASTRETIQAELDAQARMAAEPKPEPKPKPPAYKFVGLYMGHSLLMPVDTPQEVIDFLISHLKGKP